MPRTQKQPARPDLVLCRCKPRCLRFNAETGKYEGKGENVSPKVRAVHRRDERLLALLSNRLEDADTSRDDPSRVPTLMPIDDDILVGDDPDEQEKWQDLIQSHLNILDQMPAPIGDLQFVNDPKIHGPYIYDYSQEEADFGEVRISTPNTGPHALTTGANNQLYLERENTLWELSRYLQSFRSTPKSALLLGEVIQALSNLETEKALRWETIRGHESRDPYLNTEIFYRRRSSKARAVDAASILSLVLQFHYFVPRRGCEVYLSGVSDILSFVNDPISLGTATGLEMPGDPRPLATRFNLDPITVKYLSCLDCHCLYPYKQRLGAGPADANLESCTFQQTPTSQPCGAALWKQMDRGPLGVIRVPARLYVHQALKTWLGRLLSRVGMEKIIHDYPRSLMAVDGSVTTDIWQGEVFRNIKDTRVRDPLGRHPPFFPGPEGELRLAFSLSVDGFHPFQNKTAKQSATSTGIWLVLLNLPWHLRYLPQNVYLAGVIPGPQKPSNDQINHYVQLVVDDLKELFSPGIVFSRTHDFRKGRRCRGMVIPIVCDLLGAHQLVGYPGAPTAHYFCTCCELDIHDINVIDPSEWPKKDIRHIRRFAQLYRDAKSEKDQQAIFDGCGWRWSPLFELEYWNPSVYTVIDSMHALDLNMLKHHVNNLFQVDTAGPGGEALRAPSAERIKRVIAADPDIKGLKRCQDVIYENPPNLLYQLLSVQRRILYSFCLDYDIRQGNQRLVTGTRWILAKLIHTWRQKQDLKSLNTFLTRYPLVSTTQQTLIEEDASSDGEESELAEEDDLGDETPKDLRGDGSAIASGSLSALDEAVQQGGGDGTKNGDPDSGAGKPMPKTIVLKRNAKKLVDLAENRDGDDQPVYDRVTLAVLLRFCDILSLDHTTLDEQNKSKTQKRRIFDYVIRELRVSQEKRDQLRDHFSDDGLASSAPFLGMEVMQAVWRDMSRTRLPSWVTPAPRDWGTSRRGKLSADNWRVICCIHLPITLIRMFGSSTGRAGLLVDNFMKLASAVRIASASTSSPAHVAAYNEKIVAYTQGALDLYPDYSVLPSHHAGLHIGDMLHLFGPKHSHDSPFYERYISFFHRMNTNHKLGEVEATFLRTAMRNANLMSLLQDSTEDQELVKAMLERLKVHDKERLRGFRLAESLDPFKGDSDEYSDDQERSSQPLLPEDFDRLCNLLQEDPEARHEGIARNGVVLPAISHQQSVYAIWNSPKYKDSSIIFKWDNEEHAGIIQRIFLHQHERPPGRQTTRAYVSVEVYERVDGEDQFRAYGSAGGFCCKPAPTSMRLVPLDAIISHVAWTEFQEEGIIHVLPLNRRMLSLDVATHDE